MPKVFAEIAESRNKQYIDVRFDYNGLYVAAARTVPGWRFVPHSAGGPLWRYPLDLTIGRRLREAFGDDLTLGPLLRAWGRVAVRDENQLRSLTRLDNVPLADLAISRKLPTLANALRDYQRADVKIMAARNWLNGNDQGLGKTIETIGAVYEAGLEAGPKLICAPQTSLETVWADEIVRWTFPDDDSQTVYILDGDTTNAERDEIFEAMSHAHSFEGNGRSNFWLATTPYWVRELGVMQMIEWSAFICDEFHRFGMTNATGSPNKGTKFSIALKNIQAHRKFGLSGTPIGGRPIKFWGALHWKQPEVFTSKWRWAEEWLVVTDNGFGKEIGEVREGKEEEFKQHIADHMIRRLKSEVVKELPPKQYIDIWCKMGSKQRAAYKKFSRAAAIRLNDIRVSADNVLSEGTRLKQFANATCTAEHRPDGSIRVYPSGESCKLDALLEKLGELGITGDDDANGDNVAVVGCTHREMIDFVHERLLEKGIHAEKITGQTPARERTRIVREFQRAANPPRVVCLTTGAGGVALTLDRADTMFVLDEDYNPDNQRQLEDRLHRVSRIHQVTVYYMRTKGTIDEHIQGINYDKTAVNVALLDNLRGKK